MLFNAQNQVVSLTTNQIKVCNDYKKFAEMQDEGLPINKKMNITIEARNRILKPLIERKQHPNPNGRGLEGAFSLGTRARFTHQPTTSAPKLYQGQSPTKKLK